MAAPNLTVTALGDAFGLDTIRVLGPWKMGLYTANSAGSLYGATLANLTEPADASYARQTFTLPVASADDGTGTRQSCAGTSVTFPLFVGNVSIVGRFILAPGGEVYAVQPFPLPIALGPLQPTLTITPSLTAKSEL